MKSKLILALIAVCCGCAILSSCSGTTLKASVVLANSQCPTDIGNGLTMTQVTYNAGEGYVVYHIEGDSNIFNFEEDLDTDDIKYEIIQTLKEERITHKGIRTFVNLLHKENVGIIYHFYTVSPYTSQDVTLEPYEF